GRPMWTLATGCAFPDDLSAAGERAAALCMPLGAAEPAVLGLDLARGQHTWRVSLGLGRATGGVTDGTRASAIATEHHPAVLAFDAKNGAKLWETPLRFQELQLIVHGEVVVAAGITTTALRARDGALLWSSPLEPGRSRTATSGEGHTAP